MGIKQKKFPPPYMTKEMKCYDTLRQKMTNNVFFSSWRWLQVESESALQLQKRRCHFGQFPVFWFLTSVKNNKNTKISSLSPDSWFSPKGISKPVSSSRFFFNQFSFLIKLQANLHQTTLITKSTYVSQSLYCFFLFFF